ncbi:MAG: PEGA domain-containing protein, partial [Deltaproteobacteria bacterium]
MQAAIGAMRVRALAAVAVATLAAAGVARAETVAVAASTGDALTAAALQAANRKAAELGWTLVGDGVEGAAAADVMASCALDDRDCVRAAAGSLAADVVIWLRVRNGDADGARVLIGTLIDPQSGEAKAVETRQCAACTEAGIAELAADVVAALRRTAASIGPTAARLVVRSRPSGARVSVDGAPVGATELRYGVYPGDHTVAIDKPGYRVAVRRVHIDAGETETVDVTLERSGGGGPRFGAWKWVAAGAGVAAVGAGVAMIAMDGDRIEGGVRQAERRETLAPGIATAVVGAALVGAGVWMWR